MKSALVTKRPHFPPGATVGSVCKPQFVTIPHRLSAGDAICLIRESGQRGHIFYIYVIDDEERLSGIVSIRNLLLAKDAESVASIASREVVSLPESAPLQEAYRVFSQSRFLSLPVVSSGGKILGVVQAHELIEEYGSRSEELFEERTRGELFELLGIKAEHASRGVIPTAFDRLPWLLVNILAGGCSAFFIHRLGDRLPHAVLFLAFVPILLILSESIGMQTASMVIANLRRGSKKKASASELHVREFLVATALGLTCGALVSGGVYFGWGNRALALSVLLTLAGGAMWVSILGILIPRLFHHFKIDPRVAAGPVVLAIADCTTLLWYLVIAFWLTR